MKKLYCVTALVLKFAKACRGMITRKYNVIKKEITSAQANWLRHLEMTMVDEEKFYKKQLNLWITVKTMKDSSDAEKDYKDQS